MKNLATSKVFLCHLSQKNQHFFTLNCMQPVDRQLRFVKVKLMVDSQK